MNRAEYFQQQKELVRAAYRAETESVRRIRAVTRELVVPLVKQYTEQGMITFPKEELARRIDHIIREEGAKPVAAARKLQEDMERFIAEKLRIEIAPLPAARENKRTRQENAPRKAVGTVTKVQGHAFAGYSSGAGAAYYRDPQTGKIVWTDIPIELAFRKRADLSSLVWSAVEEQEEMIFDVVRGGRAAGRNVKDIAKDLETFINYPDGGKRVVGRWQGMFPNTEAGRRAGWEREYLTAHGGLQPGSDAAKAILREADARQWVAGKMAETTKRKTPRLPPAVRQYASRLGKAGLDYRAIRIARTETTAMLADEQTELARNSAISDGKMDFVMDRGRDHWNCNCEKYAAKSPWDVDDPARPEIPVHPNCMCQWRIHIKTDEEIEAEFKAGKVFTGTEVDAPGVEEAAESLVQGASPDDTPAPSRYQIFRTDDIDTIVPGHANNIPALEKSLGITRRQPATINQAVNQVNPGYSQADRIATRNCVNATLAYEFQRNGYRVEALPTPNDAPDAYITNAFKAFDVKVGDIEQAGNGRADLEERLNQFPDGARFIISQKWGNPGSEVGHDYIAEKINGRIRFIDGQQHLDDAAINLDKVSIINGKYQLYFMRVDKKQPGKDLDFSQIVRESRQILDNSLKNIVIFNKGIAMTKDEALEFLKKDYLKPGIIEGEDGTIYYQHIGEYYGESHSGEDFCFTVYFYNSKEPFDPTYAHMLFVDKETGEAVFSTGRLTPDNLKNIQETCEKINYADETSEPVVRHRAPDPDWMQFVKQE